MTTITVTKLRTYYSPVAHGGVYRGRLTVGGSLPDGLRRDKMNPDALIEYVKLEIAERYNQQATVTINRVRDVTSLSATIDKPYDAADEIPEDASSFISKLTGGRGSVSGFEASILDIFHKGLKNAQEAAARAALIKATNVLLNEFTEDIDKKAMEACRMKQRVNALQAEFEAERDFQIEKVLAPIQDLTPEDLAEMAPVSVVFLKVMKNNLAKHAKSRNSGILVGPVCGEASYILTFEDLYK